MTSTPTAHGRRPARTSRSQPSTTWPASSASTSPRSHGHRTEAGHTTIWCAAWRDRGGRALPGYHYEDMASRYARKIHAAAAGHLWIRDEPAELVCHDGQEFNYVLEGSSSHLLATATSS